MEPYNSQHLLISPSGLLDVFFRNELSLRVETMLTLCFGTSIFTIWLDNNHWFRNVCLSQFISSWNKIEGFLSSYQLKVRDWQFYKIENLLPAMKLACSDIGVHFCLGWFQHTADSIASLCGRDAIPLVETFFAHFKL